MKNLKKRKWYSVNVKPDCKYGLLIMTDMGYVFEATFENGLWYISTVRNHKVYFELEENQDSIVKWMKY